MSIPPKLVTVLGLLQLLFIAIGFGVTRGFLHLYDQVIPPMLGKYATPKPGLAVFIGAFGLWFFLVPIVWSLFAMASGENTNGMVSIPNRQFILGIALTVALALLFTSSAWLSIGAVKV
jgi:hypothetical protein